MPTPLRGYWLDGKRVPSVTTVLSRFKESGGLIHWAWTLGRDGQDYRDVKQQAADAGTCAHDMVECAIRQRSFNESAYPVEILQPARVAFGAFQRWAEQSNLKPHRTEVALISRRFRFGGTIDAVTLAGLLHLLDWKTSNSVYPDYLLQLAAYGLLWNENNPDEPVCGYELVRFSKAEGDFAHYSFTSLTKELTEFLLLRKAYEIDSLVKQRVR
jgi:PD-(D/E)XK nuclease superfamily